MAVTPARGYPLQVTGTNVNTWGNVVNTQVFSVIDQNFGGSTTISLAGLTGNVTVTTSQDENAELVLTGALAGAVVLQLPGGRSGHHFILNNATGFGVSVATTAVGSIGAPCANAAMTFVFNDGTNVTNPNASGFVTHPGSTTTTSATTFSLSTGTTASQRVIMTTPAQSVVLPNATTFVGLGGPMYSINNGGGYQFGVRRNDNTLLCVLEPGQSADLYLDDQGTAAGIWHIVGDTGYALNTLNFTFPSLYNYMAVAGGSLVPPSASGAVQVGSSTTFITFLSNNASTTTSGSLYAVAIDTSTYPATVGTPVLIDTTVLSATIGTTNQIDNSHIWISYSSSPTTNPRAVVLTLTGPSTVSPGGISSSTSNAFNGGGTLFGGCLQLSSTLYFMYSSNGSGSIDIGAVAISGTSVSYGTPVNLAASGTLVVKAFATSATSGVLFWESSGSTPIATAFTISGTTITVGSNANFGLAANGGSGQSIVACQLSTNSFIVGIIAQTTLFPTYVACAATGTTAAFSTPFVPQNIPFVTVSFAGSPSNAPDAIGYSGFAGLLPIDSTHAIASARINSSNNAVWVLTNTAGTLTASTPAYGGTQTGAGSASQILNSTFMGYTDRIGGNASVEQAITQFTYSLSGMSIVGTTPVNFNLVNVLNWAVLTSGVCIFKGSGSGGSPVSSLNAYKFTTNGPKFAGQFTAANVSASSFIWPVGPTQVAMTYLTGLGAQQSTSSYPANPAIAMWEFPT